MNKQEAIKKTEELERQLAELKAIIEAPDTSELVFKPKDDETYCFVNTFKSISKTLYQSTGYGLARFKSGNCFRTEEDAKNSAKYHIMNSEYDYWFPWSGQTKTKVLPKGLEYWDHNLDKWRGSSLTKTGVMKYDIYRWKRSEQ